MIRYLCSGLVILLCALISFVLFLCPFLPQESWANDLNQVRELMTTFIDDTMRKTNDPVFTVSEVFCSVPAFILYVAEIEYTMM